VNPAEEPAGARRTAEQTGASRADSELAGRWLGQWQRALAAWSAYTLLREPVFFANDRDAGVRGMAGEIAAIRLTDHTIAVNLETIRRQGIEEDALAILAHEIGHHVFVPGNLTDHGRLHAAMRRTLAGLPNEAAQLAANLYADLLINDRLERRAGIDISSVYRKLRVGSRTSEVWRLYTRTCEHLWSMPAGSLAPPGVSAETDADAMLLARIVRSFAGEWLKGARRFATVVYPYLARDAEGRTTQTFRAAGLEDTRDAGAGAGETADAIPDGLAEIDPSEIGEDDQFDEEILDPLGERRTPAAKPANTRPERDDPHRSAGQWRQPFEYGELLRSLGLKLSEHEVTTRYYRERAGPHLIPFPARRAPRATEPLAEGYREWDASDPVEELDPIGSILRSPVALPGITTVQRVYGEAPGADPAMVPLDLDIYVDSSGSMPDPAVHVSYLALAGAILALSALRAGARVQATVWSGAGQFETTGGFVRDENRILGTITGYLGDGTAFPLEVLRDTYASRTPDDPPAHVVVISDDGADTLLQRDEQATPGDALCRAALAGARGGGTLVLNLFGGEWPAAPALREIGFRIHRVTQWDELLRFAREFVRENYGEGT
jgi:hypothetical protein